MKNRREKIDFSSTAYPAFDYGCSQVPKCPTMDEQEQTKISKCDWCGANGESLERSYGYLSLYKCTECQHEWEA